MNQVPFKVLKSKSGLVSALRQLQCRTQAQMDLLISIGQVRDAGQEQRKESIPAKEKEDIGKVFKKYT
jgi:hypothetical protein